MMRQIKVAHVLNYDMGLKVHLGNYIQYQQGQGYRVSAITNAGRWLKKDTEIFDGVPVRIMTFTARVSPFADLMTLTRLIHYFRRERIDIVHTHTVKPGLLGRLAARIARVPVVIHTVHGYYFYDGMAPVTHRFYVMVERLASACCDLVLSQNRQDIETAIGKRICPPEKIQYLGNGIDLRQFDPRLVSPDKVLGVRRELGIPPGQTTIGFVGRWEREKGITEFLQAAAILKEKGFSITYLVIGAAQSHKKSAVSLAETVRECGLGPETIILGYRDDIPELLSLIDILVLPSYGREGVPRVLMESAALGKPVVATRVRGVVEAVDDGVTGLLVPVRDAPRLAEAIARLLADPTFTSKLGVQARKKALVDFDERQFFRKTDVAYRYLLDKKLGLNAASLLSPIPSF